MRNMTLACLGAMLCTASAFAQISPATTLANPNSSSSPAAWVYVVSPLAGWDTETIGFQASSAGKLTPIPGSPFKENLLYIAVDGSHLFGDTPIGTDIDAYKIESDGALSYEASTQVTKPGCSWPGPLQFDHTGATLYMYNIYGDPTCSNPVFDAYVVNKSTGKLTYLDYGALGDYSDPALTFTGNDEFAYTNGAPPTVLERSSNGSLTALSYYDLPPLPASPYTKRGGYWPVIGQAADPYQHVALSFQLYAPNTDAVGQEQLATYTVSSSGRLSTNSTYKNMPSVLVGTINQLNMSPSGNLLAVAGTGGLQVFHFNGANPITECTGLLSSDETDQIHWDNDDHLYAMSRDSNLLRVFSVTPTSHSQAAGSPYTINEPIALVVQTLPR